MKRAKKIVVTKDAAAPESTEILAASIIKISDGFAKLLKAGINRRALLVLIKDHTGVSQREINMVLDCLPQLKALFCLKKDAK